MLKKALNTFSSCDARSFGLTLFYIDRINPLNTGRSRSPHLLVDLATWLNNAIRAVNGDKKSRTDGDDVRRNGIKVKTDLFGKHVSRRLAMVSGRILWKRNMQGK
jgi:hypothetical protein